MTLSVVELLFLVSLFVPPAVVLLGVLALLFPSRDRRSVRAVQAHAH